MTQEDLDKQIKEVQDEEDKATHLVENIVKSLEDSSIEIKMSILYSAIYAIMLQHRISPFNALENFKNGFDQVYQHHEFKSLVETRKSNKVTENKLDHSTKGLKIV